MEFKKIFTSKFVTLLLVGAVAILSLVFAFQEFQLSTTNDNIAYSFAGDPNQTVDFSVYEAIDPTKPINCLSECSVGTKKGDCYLCKAQAGYNDCGIWAYTPSLSSCGSNNQPREKECSSGQTRCSGKLYQSCNSNGYYTIGRKVHGKCGYTRPDNEDDDKKNSKTPPGARCESPDDGVIECSTGFCCSCTYQNNSGQTVSDNRCLDTSVASNCNAYCEATVGQRRSEGIAREEKYGDSMCVTGNAACQGNRAGKKISIANGLCECQMSKAGDNYCGCVPIELGKGESCKRDNECVTNYCGDGICQDKPVKVCKNGDYICNSDRVFAKCSDEYAGYQPILPEIACDPNDSKTPAEQLKAYQQQVERYEEAQELAEKQAAIRELAEEALRQNSFVETANNVTSSAAEFVESMLESAVGEIWDAEEGESCAIRSCSPGLVCYEDEIFGTKTCENEVSVAIKSMRDLANGHYTGELRFGESETYPETSIAAVLAKFGNVLETSWDKDVQNFCKQVKTNTCNPETYKTSTTTKDGLTTSCSCVKSANKDSQQAAKISKLCDPYQGNFVAGLQGKDSYYYQERCTTTSSTEIAIGSVEVLCEMNPEDPNSRVGVSLLAANCNSGLASTLDPRLPEGAVCCDVDSAEYARRAPSVCSEEVIDFVEAYESNAREEAGELDLGRCIGISADSKRLDNTLVESISPSGLSSGNGYEFDFSVCSINPESEEAETYEFNNAVCCENENHVFRIEDGSRTCVDSNLIRCNEATFDFARCAVGVDAEGNGCYDSEFNVFSCCSENERPVVIEGIVDCVAEELQCESLDSIQLQSRCTAVPNVEGALDENNCIARNNQEFKCCAEGEILVSDQQGGKHCVENPYGNGQLGLLRCRDIYLDDEVDSEGMLIENNNCTVNFPGTVEEYNESGLRVRCNGSTGTVFCCSSSNEFYNVNTKKCENEEII